MYIGDFVKIEFDITDPIGKQGQIGKIIKIHLIDEEEAEVSALFDDKQVGIYQSNCIILLKR